jgi:hypothetical protein
MGQVCADELKKFLTELPTRETVEWSRSVRTAAWGSSLAEHKDDAGGGRGAVL